METEYCRHCGATLAADSKFCSECGKAVAESGGWGGDGSGHDRQHEPTAHATTREKETTFAAITHILGLLTWVIGPLIVLVATEDEFVEENARNALNWQIMFSIYMLLSFVLTFVLIGLVFLFLVPIVDLIVCIVAAVKANDGEAWKYPATPDLV
ncbi:zinc ribbon domain-containing protein [Natronorubrum sulfidifaciens]|uniref:Zinc-ribbon domain-containing protein n=1 Tax=Natronorubrum sulfidifaciens JCM 14089 TaxID=1230460 RepID=L9WB05_9EURY|nr:zinc ribbon domain-containing protein [Natronorubrum sulfidifaciens]ELY46644.1 hypothetical protein C495_06038 [Natronorubrum sulfidifaciens JCM 14089]